MIRWKDGSSWLVADQADRVDVQGKETNVSRLVEFVNMLTHCICGDSVVKYTIGEPSLGLSNST